MTAGVTVLDDAAPEALPPHPEHPEPGASLTRDDLLALHELLASDTWFDQVLLPSCEPVRARPTVPRPQGPRSPAARPVRAALGSRVHGRQRAGQQSHDP